MRAFSDYYGATVPLKLARSLELGGTTFEAFFIGLLGGVIIFASTLILCGFCTFYYGNVVVTSMCVAAALGLIALLRSPGGGLWKLPVGVCGLAAVGWGWIFGRYCYCAYGYFALYYTNARTYENVDPMQRGASVSDAGRLIFAAEARVDVAASAGYLAEDGVMYCAAPIVGVMDSPPRPDFWAVGQDCCGTTGGFTCDAAGDPKARSGVMLLNGPPFGMGSFVSSTATSAAGAEARARYHAARRSAEGAIARKRATDVAPPPVEDNGQERSVMFVRWVSNQNLVKLARYYSDQAWVFIALATFAFSCLSAPLAWIAGRRAVGLLPVKAPRIV